MSKEAYDSMSQARAAALAIEQEVSGIIPPEFGDLQSATPQRQRQLMEIFATLEQFSKWKSHMFVVDEMLKYG